MEKNGPHTSDQHPGPTKEDSGLDVQGGRTILKIGLIVAATAAVAAFGIVQTRVLPEFPRRFETMTREAPELENDIPLPEGDLLMGSEAVSFNGAQGYHLRCRSDRTPPKVVDLFAERLREQGYAHTDLRPGAPPPERSFYARVKGRGYAMIAWRDAEGRHVGVTAFLNPHTQGSNYFISRSEGPAGSVPKRSRDGDVPGRDIDGVVRPPASTREFCIDKPGAHPSYMALYESSLPASTVAEYYRSRMPAMRWEQPVGAAEVLSEHADGHLLSFRRGRESCRVSIVEDADVTSITLVYRGNLPGR
jgi:hypothetical protein